MQARFWILKKPDDLTTARYAHYARALYGHRRQESESNCRYMGKEIKTLIQRIAPPNFPYKPEHNEDEYDIERIDVVKEE